MTRTPISKTLRFEIFKRDRFCCQYCGRKPPEATLEVDHILPVAGGGGNDATNLVTACFDCNRGKGARSLDVAPKSLQATAEEARERREQMQALADMMQEDREAAEQWAWEVATVLKRNARDGISGNDFNSIKLFINRLGYAETLDSAYIAAAKRGEGVQRFKYFCGVCWTKIKDAAEG